MKVENIYKFEILNTKGQLVSLEKYKNKVLLIANTASECGFTGQFKDLETIYQKYKEQGFEVLGFPSNDFGGQEPLNGEELNEFCEINYGVTFQIFDKIHVKGNEQHALFKYLSDKKENGKINSTPKWNFQKYLIDRRGFVVNYYYSTTNPNSGKVQRAIEKLL
ncbi:UNVERIFIED_CONTAM: hypothetical protein GTU68_045115 [Idotea baltica]|nr:hypothetical protein [Idotea baltica]